MAPQEYSGLLKGAQRIRCCQGNKLFPETRELAHGNKPLVRQTTFPPSHTTLTTIATCHHITMHYVNNKYRGVIHCEIVSWVPI